MCKDQISDDLSKNLVVFMESYKDNMEILLNIGFRNGS